MSELVIDGVPIAGVLYDVDDTLLNNCPPELAPYNMHGHSRLAAIHAVAEELDIPSLLEIDHDTSAQAFIDSPEHTLDGTLWLLMSRLGLVTGTEIDRDNPVLSRIRDVKAGLHEEFLRTHMQEVRGASRFVRSVGAMGLPQGIASGATRSEIKMFLERYDLTEHLPPRRTIAHGDFTHPKPHPEPFVLAYATLGLPDTPQMRSRVLAFEDNPKGVRSARAAGLMVAALTTRESTEVFMRGPARADLVAADFDEYARILL